MGDRCGPNGNDKELYDFLRNNPIFPEENPISNDNTYGSLTDENPIKLSYSEGAQTQLNQILKAFGHEEKVSKNVLIIGGGNIGLNLAKMLEENFEDLRIKIIEKDKKRAEEIANELSSSIVINGDALDEEILKEANLEGSETVLALTNDYENNIMACVLAEKSGSKKRTIAIVTKTNYNILQSS